MRASRVITLALLALAGVAVAIGVVHLLAPGPPEWAARARSPLVESWASYTEAGRPGTKLTAASRPERIALVVRAGRDAWQVEALARDRDRYTAGAQRTELGQGNPSRVFADGTGSRKMRAGQERWIVERMLIPDGARAGRPDAFFVVNQFKMDGPGGPAAALSFSEDRLVVTRAASRAPGAVRQLAIGRSAVVPRDRWLKILWRVRWSAGRDGRIAAFVDLADGRGLRQIADYRGRTLKDPAPGGAPLVHPRIGIYRRAVPATTTLFFSCFVVAKSRASAEGSDAC